VHTKKVKSLDDNKLPAVQTLTAATDRENLIARPLLE
jgi:hypothetical protein